MSILLQKAQNWNMKVGKHTHSANVNKVVRILACWEKKKYEERKENKKHEKYICKDATDSSIIYLIPTLVQYYAELIWDLHVLDGMTTNMQ